VLPLLLLILFGIIDMGRLMQQQIQLTEAVREGARVGALNGTAATVQTQVSSIVGTGVALTYTSGPTVCTSSSGSGTNSSVTVSRVFAPATPFMDLLPLFGGTATTLTIKATGVMSCVG
jgi:Flp pilus assembly protein TadG